MLQGIIYDCMTSKASFYINKYAIWLLILIVGGIYSLFSVVRHLRLETYIFDLGYYDQLIWLAAHFKPIFSSILEANPWVDHFSPSIFLLTPLYWLWENVIILLIFQSYFVALGAYPLYLLAYKRTKSKLFSLCIAFAYLVFYGIQNAVAFDFHAVTLGSPILLFIFWFYEEKKYFFFWILLIVFVGLQENFFVLAAAYGVFLTIHFKDYKRGIIITLSSIFFLSLLIFYLIPNFFGAQYYYLPKTSEGRDLIDMAKGLYTPSSKIDVVFFSLLAFGFLPLFTPSIFILLVEEFVGRFLATTNSNWWILGFHYNAILAPILSCGAILAVQKFFLKRIPIVCFLVLIGTFLSLYRVKPDIMKVFNNNYYDLAETKNSRDVLELIPKDASVAATNNLGAQIAGRQDIIFLTNCHDNPAVWGPDGRRCFKLIPDYLVADLDPEGSSNNLYPDYSRESIIKYFEYVEKSGQYSLIKKIGDVYLYKRN